MKPGRKLRACGGCGVVIPATEKYCRHCRAKAEHRQYDTFRHDPHYRAVRAQVLTEETECWICGEPFGPSDDRTIDHIKAVSAGGSHERSNLRAAHRSCNAKRGARMGLN